MLLTRQGSRTGRYVPAQPRPWFGDPWNPTGIAQVPPGSAGNVNSLAFRPPSQGLAVVLSAIKFQIQPLVPNSLTALLQVPGFTYFGTYSQSSAVQLAGYQLGHAVGVSFGLAKYNSSVSGEGNDLTSGDVPAIGAFSGRVPVGTLCDSRNLMSDLLAGGYTANGATPLAFSAVNPISEYRWDLPEPFYIPPGYIFLPQFYGFGGNLLGQAGVVGVPSTQTIPTLQVQVSYEGTLLDPSRYGDDGDYTDDVTRIPFAAAYLGAPVPNNGVGGAGNINGYNDVSDETELTNIFDHRVRLTQINGKIVLAGSMNDAALDVGSSFMVRMVAANSRPLVRDFSPWRLVFDRQNRAWSLGGADGAADFALDPGEAIIAAVSGSQNATANGGAVGTSNMPSANAGGQQPIIVTTGYREVALSAL